MPDRDEFVEHVPKRWWVETRGAFEPELTNPATDRIVRRLAQDVQAHGLPCLNAICSVVDGFNQGHRTYDDYVEFLDEIDAAAGVDESPLSALVPNVVKRLFPPLPIINNASDPLYGEFREIVVTGCLIDLASKHMFPAIQLKNVVESGRMSFQDYASRRVEIQQRLRDNTMFARLVRQIVACPDGSRITVPRLAVPTVSTAEQVHAPLLTVK